MRSATTMPIAPMAHRWLALLVLVAGAVAWPTTGARAQDAGKVLRTMADFITGQQTIWMTFDSDIEVITSELQKLQFTSSGQVLLRRPDKVRATRAGGYADVELVFDGTTASVLGKNINAFAQAEAPGTVDELIDRLRERFNVAMPGADLLLTRVYDELMDGVIDAKHIGHGVIDGVDCDHLAFRTHDVDWQVWVEIGARPIPRKYVITNKSVSGAPQYTLRIKEWRTDVQLAADAFSFTAPRDAKRVEFVALREIDEIPPAQPAPQASGGRR